jgi:hypothetical protein
VAQAQKAVTAPGAPTNWSTERTRPGLQYEEEYLGVVELTSVRAGGADPRQDRLDATVMRAGLSA